MRRQQLCKRRSIKDIEWDKGIVCIMSTLIIALLSISMCVLYLWYSNYIFCNTVALTRADAIADGVAIYSQSYDYDYNKAQADIMNSMLSKYNNETSPRFELRTKLSFPENNILEVHCAATAPNAFPDISGDSITCISSARIKSVDIWGDVFVVPGSIGEEIHPSPVPEPPKDAADITIP